VWKEGSIRKGKGLRLVHNKPASPLARHGKSCQYNKMQLRKEGLSLKYLAIDRFLGPDGLVNLLSLIADAILPKDEILVLIQRLHVPGFERARAHFEVAIQEGIIEPSDPAGFYSQRDIEVVLSHQTTYNSD
jgi:hypothetical protein